MTDCFDAITKTIPKANVLLTNRIPDPTLEQRIDALERENADLWQRLRIVEAVLDGKDRAGNALMPRERMPHEHED